MPSVSKKQKHLMDAVAAGWKMPGGKGPSEKVSKEFVRADKSKASRPARANAVRRYTREAAKDRKSQLNKWAHGGDADKSRKFAIGDAKSNVGEYRT
jgi:hypothetical protein